MITELEDDCDGVIDRKDETVKIRLFNTVIHPEPINTIGVPIELDGTILGDTMRPNVNVHNGILTINNQQTRFKYLAGITDKEEFIPQPITLQPKITRTDTTEPVILKNKNAFEIRNDVLELAASIVKFTTYGTPKTEEVICEVLQAAKALYVFIENKNK
jgi:hypothetical protein